MDALRAFLHRGRKTHRLAARQFSPPGDRLRPLMAYAPLAGGRWLPTGADPRTWLLLGVSGFLGFFLCDVCLFKAMLLIGPRRVLLVFSLAPPITALVSLVIGDVLTLRQWVAMGITLAGVAWVVLERPDLGDGRSRLPSGTGTPKSARQAGPTFPPPTSGVSPWRCSPPPPAPSE